MEMKTNQINTAIGCEAKNLSEQTSERRKMELGFVFVCFARVAPLAWLVCAPIQTILYRYKIIISEETSSVKRIKNPQLCRRFLLRTKIAIIIIF